MALNIKEEHEVANGPQNPHIITALSAKILAPPHARNPSKITAPALPLLRHNLQLPDPRLINPAPFHAHPPTAIVLNPVHKLISPVRAEHEPQVKNEPDETSPVRFDKLERGATGRLVPDARLRAAAIARDLESAERGGSEEL